MIKSTFDLEKKMIAGGYDWVIGIDEAGRGPLAGPVVACAATVRNFKFEILNFKSNSNDQISNDKMIDLIRDSKTLSAKQRESLFDLIQENFYVGVGICDHETIDRMNILEASFLSMKKAVSDLMKNLKRSDLPACQRLVLSGRSQPKQSKEVGPRMIILLDGNKPIPNFSAEQKAVVNGDKFIKSISAASIIAKVTRDRMMLAMHEKYPEYGFDKHKGYGTRLHMEMLSTHGPCEIHRKSFRPVKIFAKRKK
jgi:ribonuclease HII